MFRIGIVIGLCTASVVGGPEQPNKEKVTSLVQSIRMSASEFDFSTEEGQNRFKEADVRASESASFLLAILQKSPEMWTHVRPMLRRLPDDPKRRDEKLRLIEVLSHDADKESVALLDAEVKANPRGIAANVLIRMDLHGSKQAPELLKKLVAEKPAFRNLEAAIHLGLKKDSAAKPVLKWAIESGAGTRHFMGISYGTAIAWKRLGDNAPWKKLEKRAIEEVKKAVKAKDLKSARWFALQLQYYRSLASSDKPINVLALDGGCASHVVARGAEVNTTSAVLAIATAKKTVR